MQTRSIIVGAALAVLGGAALFAVDRVSGIFAHDRSEELISTMLKPDMVVGKTTTARHAQKQVCLYDPVAQQLIKRTNRLEAEAEIASKLYANVAIVVPNKYGVCDLPDRNVTIVVNK